MSKLKSPEEHYLRLLQLYVPWRNEYELKKDNQSHEDRYKEVECNILDKRKKHEPYLDIDYQMMKKMINPNLLDLDLEDSDSVSNALVVPTIIENLLLPNEQFYIICCQLNEGQQHLFNFKMQYALYCKLKK